MKQYMAIQGAYMATIKEVAALAGVSIGTVSNVLNGKTDNAALISLVEKAIEELDYRPDMNARNLKNTRTNTIALILPNTVKQSVLTVLSTVEKGLMQRGYSLLLKISRNNAYLEKKCIQQCLDKRVDGIIVYVCDNTLKYYKQFADESTPILYISENSILKNLPVDIISVDYGAALDKAFKANVSGKVGVIFERSMLDIESIKEIYHNYYSDIEDIRVIDYSQERGFKAAFEILCNDAEVRTFITSSSLIAHAAKKAASMLGKTDISYVCVKEPKWLEDDGEFVATISPPYGEIAEIALSKIMEAIDHSSSYEPKSLTFKAEYLPANNLMKHIPVPQKTTTLNFYMFDCPATRAFEMLSKIYSAKTGIEINIDIFPYSQLEDNLYTLFEQKKSSIDGVMMDIVWLDEMKKTGGLLPLDTMIKDKEGYLRGFEEFNEMIRDTIYGIPFVSGTQFLLYQNDLFEDNQLKRLYKRMYGSELEIPDTWSKFNLVAEFFTKKYNPKSPVQYGTSAIRGVNAYTSLIFLNYLWAYGSDIFENDNVVINNPNSLNALKNFIKSYQYAHDNGSNKSWDDVVKEFRRGDCAMTIIYDSHAVDINDYSKSKVAGNIGYAVIPGRQPVLGGWYLGINAQSKQKQAAVDFIMWACSNRTSIPYSLLGGTSLRMGSYERSDLDNIYPWKNIVAECYHISRKRQFSQKYGDNYTERNIYTHLIPEELERALNGEQTPEQTLVNIEQRIKKMGSNS